MAASCHQFSTFVGFKAAKPALTEAAVSVEGRDHWPIYILNQYVAYFQYRSRIQEAKMEPGKRSSIRSCKASVQTEQIQKQKELVFLSLYTE